MLTAAMVGKTHGRSMRGKMEPEGIEVSEGYLKLFAVASELREKYDQDFDKLPAGAIGRLRFFRKRRFSANQS